MSVKNQISVVNEASYLELENIHTWLKQNNLENDDRFKIIEKSLNNWNTILSFKNDVNIENKSDDNNKIKISSNETIFEPSMDAEMLQQLKSQVAAYRILSRGQNVPENILLSATTTCYSKSSNIGNESNVQYNWEKVFDQQSTFLSNNLKFTVSTQDYIQERQRRLKYMLENRKNELESIIDKIEDSNLQIKALIEYKSIKLVDLQISLRKKIVSMMNPSTYSDNTIGSFSNNHFVLKKFPLRDMKNTDRFEKHQKLEEEKQKRIKNQEFVNCVLAHSKEFREFYRQVQNRIMKVNKLVLTYHLNFDREKKREEERIEKERLRRLMLEDEEGYRKLLDEKKDKRLTYLLSQTDEFIASLTEAVKNHKIKQLEFENCHNSKFSESYKSTSEMNDESNFYAEDDDFVNIVDKNNVDKENYYNIAHSIKEDVSCQPSILVCGKLKEYQLKGLEWLVSIHNNNLNGILADEMGLGKTIQTIAFLAYLYENKKIHGPFLIIVPLSTLSNWMLEFEKWCPKLIVYSYKGSPQYRKSIASVLKSNNFNVLLTTYEYIIKDRYLLSKFRWIYMIVDEGHRMKNHHCKLTTTINTYYAAKHRILLTGTPLQNRIPELWALLNFLLPDIFNSCNTFDQWFNAPFAYTGEKMELNEEETFLIIRRLHKILRPFLLRRLKKEVESQLPDKVEYVLKCEMSALQKILYRHMQQRGVILIEELENEFGKIMPGSKSLKNTIVQLRKICNHPFLFHHIETSFVKYYNSKLPNLSYGELLLVVSGKFILLDNILPKLIMTKHRTLIFCQMTNLMSIMEDFLIYKGIQYLRLDGTTKADDRGNLLHIFNDPNSQYYVFLLSTRAGGLGLNLQVADTVIIFDSDWNPQQDLQAQDRAHRIGQKNEVRVLRLLTVNSVEEKILSAAKFKLNLDEKVIQAGMFNQNSTNSERKAFLEALLENDNTENNIEESETPDEETINQIITRSEEEFKLFQEIDEKNVKKKLIDETELPDWLIKHDIEIASFQNDSNPSTVVQGKRQRKEVDYSDLMLTGEEEFDDTSIPVDANPSKKSRRSNLESSPNKVFQKMEEIVNAIYRMQEDGRFMYEAFYELPSKKVLPDYYKTIKFPMDFKRIQEKISKCQYDSLNDFEYDILLIFSNAKTYNEDDSQIFKDAMLLESKFQNILEKTLSESLVNNFFSNSLVDTQTSSATFVSKRIKKLSTKRLSQF